MAEPAARRPDDAAASWAALACVFYAAAFAGLRLAAVPALFYDDTLEVLRAQSWSLAYVSNQPPLYTWMVRAAVLAMGDATTAHVALKYACLAGAALCVFNAARATIGDARLAALALGSLLLVWDLGAEVHRDLTQSVLLFAFIAATWLIVVRIVRDRVTTARALALGLIVAGGALTKYSYLVYLAALAAAAALDAGVRARFADRRIALAGAIAVALVVPHLLAMQELGSVSAALFQGRAVGAIERRVAALYRLAFSIVVVSLPLPFVWLAFFPQAFRRARPGATPPGTTRDAAEALLARWIVATLALFVVGAVALGATNLRQHYLQPLVILAAILFFARLARLAPSPVALRRFTWAVGAAALAGLLITAGRLELEARSCSRCQPVRDYAPAAQALARAGAGAALIIGDDRQAVANLLVRLPQAHGWAIEDPPAAIPPDAAGRPCALVWGSAVGAPGAAPLPDWARGLVRTPPGVGTVETVASPIRGLLGRAQRLYTLSFAVVPPESCILPARSRDRSSAETLHAAPGGAADG